MAKNKQREIPKAYDPSKVEDKWYKYWQDNKIFHSDHKFAITRCDLTDWSKTRGGRQNKPICRAFSLVTTRML